MRRWGFWAVVSLMFAMPLGAQRVQSSRLVPSVPAAPFMSIVTDTVPKTGRRPLPPGFVTQQALVGLAGFSVGALAGGFVGSAFAGDGDGFQDLAGVIMGLAIGGALGSSITVYRFSNAKGYRSSYVVTLLGSVAGFFGGPLLWITVPIGSTIGYNVVRK